MKITEGKLRQIIREELGRLGEMGEMVNQQMDDLNDSDASDIADSIDAKDVVDYIMELSDGEILKELPDAALKEEIKPYIEDWIVANDLVPLNGFSLSDGSLVTPENVVEQPGLVDRVVAEFRSRE